MSYDCESNRPVTNFVSSLSLSQKFVRPTEAKAIGRVGSRYGTTCFRSCL